MDYVFDTGAFSALFRNYFVSVFPTLWTNFDALITSGGIISVAEVMGEIEDSSLENMRKWKDDNNGIFHRPTAEEADIIRAIYKEKHFQNNIEKQKILKGGKIADPFVIAKAGTLKRAVVTSEKFKPNAAKIPNICKHFAVTCFSMPEFMENEGWKF